VNLTSSVFAKLKNPNIIIIIIIFNITNETEIKQMPENPNNMNITLGHVSKRERCK